ncbi:IS3 family transposase [Acidaminobacter sp. JC074]|uniref:IS3 family transposase n=1 Tax=Acidaminobacter sp. JC074 TaxID=2530199 RepID=UPI001F10326F|nr:IS3 family transposase [Acidaminobacter sp. JC074]MCH4891314.1 IS3 family transposase [Acidaminobacter sp. JC074]
MLNERRPRRNFTTEFKEQVVQLYLNGKTKAEIKAEYNLYASTLDTWIKQHQENGSFKSKDNLSDLEKELIELRKRNKQLEMENDIFKASSADNRTKVAIINSNKDKYSISAMCGVLKISRSTYYYELQKTETEPVIDPLTKDVIRIFKANRKCYGTRRIRKALRDEGIIASRRRIGRIMKENGLISTYTVAKYKPHKPSVNEAKIENKVNREFNDHDRLNVIVSDLTYVRVNGSWNYVCLILDLFNREIIGYSAGKHKTAELVYQAFATIQHDLHKIKIFHTDRGNEFKNNTIESLLETFNIDRSLSQKGCPYDNAVAEATFKSFKKEFVYQYVFEDLNQLKRELFDYVNWYNNIRLHSSLGYLSPTTYKFLHLKKTV